MIQQNSSKEEADNFKKYIHNIFVEQKKVMEKHSPIISDFEIL